VALEQDRVVLERDLQTPRWRGFALAVAAAGDDEQEDDQ